MLENLKNELIKHRRFLHENAESGKQTLKSFKYIAENLRGKADEISMLGNCGLLAVIGHGEKTVLLRADVDALPLEEKTSLPFRCKNGNMHACGHDMHTAMLLGVADLLKIKPSKNRTILLFQSGEELLEGAREVLNEGLLEKYNPQAAVALHVLTDTDIPSGTIIIPKSGACAPAASFFKITVFGEGCHGAAPQNGKDSIKCLVNILNTIYTEAEFGVLKDGIISFGTLSGGAIQNAISESSVAGGTIRTKTERELEKLKLYMTEIVSRISRSCNCFAKTVWEGHAPELVNDAAVTKQLSEIFYLNGLNTLDFSKLCGSETERKSGGSEDFACIAKQIPSCMPAIAAGETRNGYVYPLHNKAVIFDEEALLPGCLALYYSAMYL